MFWTDILNIAIETSSGGTLAFLEPKVGDTIEDVKAMIQDKIGIPCNQQRLVFGKRQLEDSCMLLDCNIDNNSRLLLEGNQF